MKSEAIINNKEVILDESERKNAESFHKNRIAFAIIKGQLVFNSNPNDDRDHQHWLCEDFGISIDEWEHSPRGYMLPNNIQLFIGSDFRPVDMNLISKENMNTLVDSYCCFYRNRKFVIYNGVRVGKVGEIWPPIEIIETSDFF